MSIYSQLDKLINMKEKVDYYEISEQAKILNNEIENSNIPFQEKAKLIDKFNTHYSDIGCRKLYVTCELNEWQSMFCKEQDFDISNIKVSLILPIYNKVNYGLARGISSCLNQTHRNIEIICVNDCSTDNSRDVINFFAKKDNRIILLDLKENAKCSGARIAGWEVATGDYIVNVDPDDWIDEDYIENMLYTAVKFGVDFVEIITDGTKSATSPLIIEERAKIKTSNKDYFVYGHIRSFTYPYTICEYFSVTVLMWGKLYSKSMVQKCMPILKKLQGVNNREDDLLNFYLFDDILSGVVIETNGYNYTPNEDSLSLSNPTEKRAVDESYVFGKIIGEYYCLDYLKSISLYFFKLHPYCFFDRKNFSGKNHFFKNMSPSVMSTLLAFSFIHMHERLSLVKKHPLVEAVNILLPKGSIRYDFAKLIYRMFKVVYKLLKNKS